MTSHPFNQPVTINPSARDFNKNQKDYAVFLPSISSIYAKQISKPKDRIPAGLPKGMHDLNFLEPDGNLFYYPAALYSAGHAVLDTTASDDQEAMVQKRDRSRTTIVGDSGGYQIATGVLKWPWQKKSTQTDAEWSTDKDKIRLQILRWLEHTADYSMVLDVPTGSLFRFGNDPVTGENLHPGVKSFQDCLNSSMENHDFFIRNRVEGATKFMNVLQGRTIEEGDIWWDVVKDLPFETWAFSGVQASNFAMNLRRLIIMRDGKYLEGRDWLHYLGNGKLKAGCALTTLQRTLRKHVTPGVTLSFDAASPFVNVAKGNIYYSWVTDDKHLAFKGGSMPDDKSLKGSTELFNHWISKHNKKWPKRPGSIGDRITIGDICIRGYQDLKFKKLAYTKDELLTAAYLNSPEGLNNELFRYTNEYHKHLINTHNDMFDWGSTEWPDHEKYQVKWPSSLDGLSYVLAMHHNVDLHIDSIQQACAAQDLPPDQASQMITPDLLEFANGLCEEIFTSQRPMDLIEKHSKMLGKIMGMDANNDISRTLEDIT